MTQSHSLDVISQNAGELVRREQARELAANVVQAIFRLVKLSTLHSIENQAVVRQVEETVQLVNDYGLRAGMNVSILFAYGSIFVGGQLLKANRSIYEGATELGEVLKKGGASELGIAKDVRAADLYSFCSAIADVQRASSPQKLERPSPRIRLRAVSESALKRGMAVERLQPTAAIVRTYASAVVIMRRFLEDLQKGRYFLPQRVKRIAQGLVDLSEGETPAFLGVTAVRNANHDEAGRAVNTAILSVSIARQITTDQVTLVRLAMAALLFDTGRPRLAGIRPGAGRPGIIPQLSEQQEAEVPAGTAVVLTALGRVNEPSVMRTVIGYEAHWVRRQKRLGPLYKGLRQATIQSRIIATARAFNDLLTPAPGATPMSADEAIARLEAEATEAADRTVLRLLFGALGIFPTGTLVELSTGEVALVVQTHAHPSKYSQPRVRIVFDASGGAIHGNFELDLSQRPGRGEPKRHIKRVVATADDPGAANMRQLAQGAGGSGVRTPPSGTSGASWPSAASQPAPESHSQRQASYPPPAYAQPSAPQHATPPAYAPTSAAPQPAAYAPQPYAQPEPYDREPYAQPEAYAREAYAEPAQYAPAQVHAQPAAPSWEQPAYAPSQARTPTPPPSEAHAIEAQDTTDDGAGATRAVSWNDQAYLLSPEAAPAQAARARPDPQPTARPAASAAPEPTAEGNLTRTPLVHLLVYMLDQRLTGTTVFHTPERTAHAVYFMEGAPAKVRTGSMIAPLDRIILELGLLDEATLRGTLLEISKKKILHGRHLVARGLLDRETVLAALRLQVMRKLQHMFELPAETRYAYYDGNNLLASWGGPELTACEPLAVIMAGIRLRADDPLVDATLERISGRPMALHLDADMRRFELTRQETAICDLLRARRMTLGDLLQAGAAPERVVMLTVYALAITRHLDLGVAGRPPVGVLLRERTGVSSVVEPGPVAIRNARATAPPPADEPPAPTRTFTPAPASPPPAARTFTPAPGSSPSPAPQSTGLRLGGSSSSAADAPPDSQRRGAPAPKTDAPARRTGFGMGFGAPAARPSDPGAPAQAPAAFAAARAQAPAAFAAARAEAPAAFAAAGPSGPAAAPPADPYARPAQAQYPSAPEVPAPPPAQRGAQPMPGARPATPSPPPATPSPPPVARSAPPAISNPPPSGGRADTGAPSGSRQSYDSISTGQRVWADIPARRAEMEQRLGTIEREDYFQLLGLAHDATHDQVQKAYFAVAKMWHPDRLPPELEDLKLQVSRAFARFNEAYQALNDPQKRAEYTALAKEGRGVPEDQEKIARVVDAALEFQKAEVLLKKHDLAGAEALATRAVAADPEQPEYLTLLVWIQAQRRGEPPPVSDGRTTTHYDDLIKTLDRVLSKEPRYERALFYRGMLLKRAGRGDKAIKDFRLAAEINPKNLDAVREVRVHDMRKRGGAPADAPQGGGGGGGLLGKLFKK